MQLEALTTLVLEENHLAMEEDWLKRRGVIVFVVKAQPERWQKTSTHMETLLKPFIQSKTRIPRTDKVTERLWGKDAECSQTSAGKITRSCGRFHRSIGRGHWCAMGSALVHWHAQIPPNSLSSEIGVLTGGCGVSRKQQFVDVFRVFAYVTSGENHVEWTNDTCNRATLGLRRFISQESRQY